MRGQYAQATAAYERLAQAPEHMLTAGLGLARCRLETGQYDEAIVGLAALAAEESADWHFAVADALLRVGRYDEVMQHAQAASKLQPRHAGARLLLGQVQELLGRREAAIETYTWFDKQVAGQAELPRDAERLTALALGFLRYSVLTQTSVPRRTQHVLNEMLQVAYERLDRAYWPARIAAADLLREKYNNDEADGSVADYRGALRINEKLPEAHVGLGAAALEEWNLEQAEWHAEQALTTNPNFAPAPYLLAQVRIIEDRYAEGRELCRQALAINPNDLIALSLQAALAASEFNDAEVQKLAAQVAALNPRCAAFHTIVGVALSSIRQYEACERELRLAIEFDPTDANPRTTLGMMYMQWGHEEKAREVLEASWGLDPYNERTKFTLELLESLEAFARHETEHFIVKYDQTRDPGLGAFLGTYLEQVYPQITGDYEHEPPDKTIIEVFPTHRAFGVRITGRPWIHTVGACTGRVIAVETPRASTEVMGTYNLMQVLRHEFAHTVTLSATNNRIPHWFTEALAVQQEEMPRPFAWWSVLAAAAREDRLFSLADINWGFIRPRRPDDPTQAYAQSEWMSEYLVQRFGYDCLNQMLRRFRDGQSQAQVFQELFQLSEARFDLDFRAWARGELTRLGFDLTAPENVEQLRTLVAAEPQNAALWGRLARAELHWADEPGAVTLTVDASGKATGIHTATEERALQAARRALALDEDEPAALEVLALILFRAAQEAGNDLERRGHEDELLPVVQRLRAVRPANWNAPKLQGAVHLRREEYEAAVEAFQALQRLCPLDPASWQALSAIYLKRKQDDLALPQLMELARLDCHDPDVPNGIARIQRARGQLNEALYWYRRALHVDPFSAALRQALAETCMLAGDTQAALEEYVCLTRLEPQQARYFEQAAFAAHKLGDRERAQELARQAVTLDAQSAARALLP